MTDSNRRIIKEKRGRACGPDLHRRRIADLSEHLIPGRRINRAPGHPNLRRIRAIGRDHRTRRGAILPSTIGGTCIAASDRTNSLHRVTRNGQRGVGGVLETGDSVTGNCADLSGGCGSNLSEHLVRRRAIDGDPGHENLVAVGSIARSNAGRCADVPPTGIGV